MSAPDPLPSHVISVNGPISYPGGKNGSFQATCSCGHYRSGTYVIPRKAAKAGLAHAESKGIIAQKILRGETAVLAWLTPLEAAEKALLRASQRGDVEAILRYQRLVSQVKMARVHKVESSVS